MRKSRNRLSSSEYVLISALMQRHSSGRFWVRQNSLQNIFKQDLAFTGSFSFHQAYPEAPNPCLHVKGIGTIGLPLHVRDAEAIKARALQAPFGKATKTLVDKSVRDTWEIDGKEVSRSFQVDS